MVKKDENVFNDNGSYTFGDDRIRFIILESRGKDKSAKRDKNKRTTVFNDTLIIIKLPQNASTHPLSLPLSLLSDASAAVSILLPH